MFNINCSAGVESISMGENAIISVPSPVFNIYYNNYTAIVAVMIT